MAGLFSLHACLLAGLFVRLTCMLYGICQDATMAVKYTDIDYHVFSDAARFVTQGESPYKRATYRYTPLLAWMLIPNIYISMVWGKLLFICCDVLAGYLIYKIVTYRGASQTMGIVASWTWLLNPLPITVSSRGSAESIMAVLVLATFFSLCHRRTKLAALLYGISVHFKIYPITYSLPLYFVLSKEYSTCTQNKHVEELTDDAKETIAQGKTYRDIMNLLWPNRQRLTFVGVSVGVFSSLTALCYYLYGWDFLHETYLYHVTRKDTRHNFSVYFYLLYLTESTPYSTLLGIATFLPQGALLVIQSFKFHRDPIFAAFINTVVFVAFNKVCTSQYFLWYLTLLPVVLPSINMQRSKMLKLVLLWFGGQAVWLFPAYLLEFEGMNTFFWIWLASILFFLINIYILYSIISQYQFSPMFQHGRICQKGEAYVMPAWIQFYVHKSHQQ